MLVDMWIDNVSPIYDFRKKKKKPLKQCQFWHKKEGYFKIKLGSGQVLSQ